MQTVDDAIKHWETKLHTHNPVDSSGSPAICTTVSATELGGCKCEDCGAIRAILEERKRMKACIEKIQKDVNGWRYAC